MRGRTPESALIHSQAKEGVEDDYTHLAAQIADHTTLANLVSAEVDNAGGLGAFSADKADQFVRDWRRQIYDLGVPEGSEKKFIETLAREIQRRRN